ncbi:DEAD-box ATP-dependent RNA helicase 7 [Zancudomyces culisetae]|uniref:RNA helicase n=1 Tax=Zancudomyces culisetae TaxID=1213189 RepID=A0A1R1PZ71_ZANCU|nr:DEAD-box ATP-dependent RNA helicase 7 [Zancudomyces culisetae]|eukprot:OMH86245.1 DEAD-box ATP-dependent RNA helicase 7 [Zancudomyces culisetae]
MVELTEKKSKATQEKRQKKDSDKKIKKSSKHDKESKEKDRAKEKQDKVNGKKRKSGEQSSESDSSDDEKKTKSEKRSENGERESKRQKVDEESDSSDDSNTEETEDIGEEEIGPIEHIILNEGEEEGESDEYSVDNYGLRTDITEGLKNKGIKILFPIQRAVLAPIMEGKDVLARARTGTGKTLGFGLPIIQKLLGSSGSNEEEKHDNGYNRGGRQRQQQQWGRPPRAIIMAPTRELAKQVASEIESITNKLKVMCIYGGTSIDQQVQGLRSGVDIVVGTPGRLLDHLNRGRLNLKEVEFMCLDEADQMLDIGFKDDMEAMLKSLREARTGKYQVLLFSATVPEWVHKVVGEFMKNYVKIDLIGKEKLKTSELIKHMAIQCSWAAHHDIVSDLLSVYGMNGRAIIFAETKVEVNNLVAHPKLKGNALPLHGDITQALREQTLTQFRQADIRFLVCTDVAARGLDIPEVDLVINSEPPRDAETYIHRSGRTGRAGRSGMCITLFTPQKGNWLDMIKRFCGIECELISPPQVDSIAVAAGNSAAETVSKCNKQVVSLFSECAQTLADSHFGGNVLSALAASLATISGYSAGLKERSLLTGSDSLTTLVMTLKEPARFPKFAKSVLERNFNALKFEDTNNFRITPDHSTILFDIRSDLVRFEESNEGDNDNENEYGDDNGDVIASGQGSVYICNKLWRNTPTMSLSKCTELPELEPEQNNRRSNGSNPRYGFNSNNYSFRNGGGGGGGEGRNGNGYRNGNGNGYRNGGRGGDRNGGRGGDRNGYSRSNNQRFSRH